MSSAIRAHAQIPARIKFMLVVTTNDSYDPSGNPSSGGVSAFEISGGSLSGTFFTDAGIIGTPGYLAVDPLVGQLYRDLGKQIVIVDANDKHLAYFRLARRQNGVASEGIGAEPNIWIKVWAAAGEGVVVARTG